jgi:hypothetical protein
MKRARSDNKGFRAFAQAEESRQTCSALETRRGNAKKVDYISLLVLLWLYGSIREKCAEILSHLAQILVSKREVKRRDGGI